jgi:hypothetical protein
LARSPFREYLRHESLFSALVSTSSSRNSIRDDPHYLTLFAPMALERHPYNLNISDGCIVDGPVTSSPFIPASANLFPKLLKNIDANA